MSEFVCFECGNVIHVDGYEERVTCNTCQQEYERVNGETWWDVALWFLGGLFVGAVFVGPFIWTPLGRATTITAISRGAGVASAKVEEWLAAGEK